MTDPTKPREGEDVAFDKEHTEAIGLNTYRAIAFTVEDPRADARVVILRNGELLGENESYPAYKIYDVAAHLPDMASTHERALRGEVETP